MNIIKCVSVLFAVSLLSSCATTFNKSHNSGALNIQLKSNLTADLDVDMSKKIQGVSSATKLFYFITLSGPDQFSDGVVFQADNGGTSLFGPGPADEVKSAAVHNALSSAKAEIIVAPQYIMKTKSIFLGAYKEINVQVTGYAGRIKTIKNTNESRNN